jgi:hypothetical protein
VGAGRPVRSCGRYTENFYAAHQGTKRWTDTSSRCLHPEVRLPIAAGLLYPWMGVLPSPIIASAAMKFGSVQVSGNALWLRRVRL